MSYKQSELFPQSSKHHSTHALRQKHEKQAQTAVKRGPGRQAEDITGQRFGNLLAIKNTGRKHDGSYIYTCHCSCGMDIEATSRQLKRSSTPLTHCGCKGVGKAGKVMRGGLGLGGRASSLFEGKRQKRGGKGAFASLYANYRNAATKRGYSFDLTEAQFRRLTKGKCYYCGVRPSQEYKGHQDIYVYNGVDRVDSDMGYSVANCVSCCGTCNTAKGAMHAKEFKGWIRGVYEHLFG